MRITPVISALLALAVAGCEKPSDLGKLEEEAKATVARDQPAIARLDHRADMVRAAFDTLPPTPDTPAVKATIDQAFQRLAELHGVRDGVAAKIADGKTLGPEALHKVIDETADHQAFGIREVNANLTAAESWVWQHKSLPRPKMPTPALLAPTDDDLTPGVVPAGDELPKMLPVPH